jgi:hypothetical protein
MEKKDEGSLAEDLLWGSQAIAVELGVSRRAAFHLLTTRAIPARKVNALWVASRSQLREHLLSSEAV